MMKTIREKLIDAVRHEWGNLRPPDMIDLILKTLAGIGDEEIAEESLVKLEDCADCACDTDENSYDCDYFKDRARPIIRLAIGLALAKRE